MAWILVLDFELAGILAMPLAYRQFSMVFL